MTRSKPGQRRWLIGILVLVVAIVAVPGVGVAHYMINNAVGRTTVAKNADGTERTVFWRGYPAISGLDPQEILQGPTPEEGLAFAQNMVAEIKAALTAELALEWAPEEGWPDSRPFHRPVQNYFGGESLLTVVNGPESQTTSVPQTWADKQRAIGIIGKITDRYGYEAPTIDSLDRWSDEDRIRDLGGLSPEKQVIVSGMVQGPAGQWLAFRFQDLSKDADGRFEERFRPLEGSHWQMNTLALSYGANGLLAEEAREEFKSRLEPFLGLTPPEPLES